MNQNNFSQLKLSPNKQKEFKKSIEFFKTELDTLCTQWDIEHKKDTRESSDIRKLEKRFTDFLKKDSLLAHLLIETFNLHEKILYDEDSNLWYLYEHEKQYLWSPVKVEEIIELIENKLMELIPIRIYLSINYETRKRNDLIEKQLKNYLAKNIKQQQKDYCIFSNCVVSLENNKKVLDPKPTDYLTSYSILNWTPGAECQDILNGLKFIFNEDDEKIKLFQAICQIIFKTNKEFNLQFFVELKGSGGVGKSLLQNLLEKLVPTNKRTSTNLKIFESSQYETAILRGKNLIIFPETNGFVGEASNLKSATGGDLLRGEEKGKQNKPFYFYGVALITTNTGIRYSQAESSIVRRRIQFELKKQISYFTNETGLMNETDGLWTLQLPGFVQWIFEIKPEEVKKRVQEYLNTNKYAITDNSELSTFVKNNIIPFKGGEISIYINNNIGKALYTLYEQSCNDETGGKLGKSNFRSLILTELINVFPDYDTIKEHKYEWRWVLKDVMYLQLMPEEYIPKIIYSYKKRLGPNAIHDIKPNDALKKILNESKTEHKMKKFLKHINEEDSWHKHIGILSPSLKPFDEEYNLKLFNSIINFENHDDHDHFENKNGI